jgi:hypothetical protein
LFVFNPVLNGSLIGALLKISLVAPPGIDKTLEEGRKVFGPSAKISDDSVLRE